MEGMILGNLLAFLGSIIAILGAIYNCTGTYCTAGKYWMFSNSTLGIAFLGAYLHWWDVDIGLLPTIIMYAIFMATSVMLWRNNRDCED